MCQSLPILTFHSIDCSRSVLSTSPAFLREFLGLLKCRGYRTLSMADVVQWSKGNLAMTDPSVVLTFDDGYENVFYNGFPVLQELGFKATLFLTSGYVGKMNNWPSQPSGIPCMDLLNWGQIAEMAKSVFSIEAHSMTHPRLTALSKAEAREEILTSKSEIESRLGSAVNYFAYPYGIYDGSVSSFVGEHFQAACTTNCSYVSLNASLNLLPRIDMYYFSRWSWSGLFGSSLQKPYLSLIKQIRRLRKRDGQPAIPHMTQ